MNIFDIVRIKFDYLIKQEDRRIDRWKQAGWDTIIPEKARHCYLLGLLEHQLDNFDRT